MRPKPACFKPPLGESLRMGLPSQSVTISAEELGELNRKLSSMCHDVRNSLSVIAAAADLMRHKPDLAERMVEKLSEHPGRITNCMDQFRADFEKAFGISRP